MASIEEARVVKCVGVTVFFCGGFVKSLGALCSL